MSSKAHEPPKFVFIGGAVGSGNTLLFECLIRDPNVYGINEDQLGPTLAALVLSEKEMGACPHSVSAFVKFMLELRGDRQTLILKTPANIRYLELIEKKLPDSSFLMTIRNPHAAIASGLSRHKDTVEAVASIWESDYLPLLRYQQKVFVVPFESMLQNPRNILEEINNNLLPLHKNVFSFAHKITDPDRASDTWWRKNIDSDTQYEIENVVKRRNLMTIYKKFTGSEIDIKNLSSNRPRYRIQRRYRKLRRILVIGHNRIRKTISGLFQQQPK